MDTIATSYVHFSNSTICHDEKLVVAETETGSVEASAWHLQSACVRRLEVTGTGPGRTHGRWPSRPVRRIVTARLWRAVPSRGVRWRSGRAG